MPFAVIAPLTPAPGMTGLMQQIPLCLTAAVRRSGSRPEVGLDAYIGELRAKRAILDNLLAGYNDGRRKTSTARRCNLLPLEDLQSVVAKLENLPDMFRQRAGHGCREAAARGS